MRTSQIYKFLDDKTDITKSVKAKVSVKISELIKAREAGENDLTNNQLALKLMELLKQYCSEDSTPTEPLIMKAMKAKYANTGKG